MKKISYKAEGSWWAFWQDAAGNQVGDAVFAHLKRDALAALDNEPATPLNETPKSNRGGIRPGQGRKTRDGIVKPLRATVALDAETMANARIIGGGNMSEGLRLAVKESIQLRAMIGEPIPPHDPE